MGFLTTFAFRFNKNCDMDYLPKDPAIMVSSVNMLLRGEEFDTLGRADFLRDHKRFQEDITKAVEILEKML